MSEIWFLTYFLSGILVDYTIRGIIEIMKESKNQVSKK